MLDPLATMLYEKSLETNAMSRITNAVAAIPHSEYIVRRADTTHTRAPVRAPYRDAQNP